MTDGSKITIHMEEKKDTEVVTPDATEEENSENAYPDESEQDQEDSSSQKKEPEIDYEAELEIEKKRGLPDPEKAKEAFKKRKEKREAEEGEETEEEDDKPLTRKDLSSIRQSVAKEMYADRVQEIAQRLSSSDAEARLIVEIHKNRTFPEGMPLPEQLEEAYVIANRKKILSTTAELKRALLSKDTVSKNTAGTHRDNVTTTTPKMSTADSAAYTRAGFTFDPKLKVFKKKLPNGFLFKDPKTKRTWTGK